MGIAYNTSIVRDGLVLHLDAANPKSYPGSGTVWGDLSGNGNHGTLLSGPTYSSNNLGNFDFDGTDDQINFGNILNFPDTLTVNFWVKDPDPSGVIISKGSRLFEIRIGNSIFAGYIGTTDNGFFDVSSQVISHDANASNWNNFTYVINYASTNVKLYANGNKKGEITIPNMTSSNTPTYDLRIGRRVESLTNWFPGNISIVQIHNRVLLDSEIRQNFESLRGRYDA